MGIKIITEELNLICTYKESRRKIESEREWIRVFIFAVDADILLKNKALQERKNNF